VHNPVNIAISFVVLIAVVGGSFFYVSSSGLVKLPPKPWIGITEGLVVNPARAEALGLNQQHGLLIINITQGSPAQKAGLMGANNVTVIDGVSVPTGPEDVCAVLAQKEVGDAIKFVIDRRGEVREIDVVLEELPPQATSTC